jgi:AraC-like DNA-binding protein
MANTVELRAALTHFGHISPQVKWQMARHVHDDFNELILVVSGTLEVNIHGQRIYGQPGDLLTYPRHVWHTEQAVGEDPLETLFLAWKWQVPETGIPWPLHATDRSGRSRRLIYWMHELFPPTRPGERHMLGVLLDALLFEVDQLAQSREQQMVAQTKAYVQHHMAKAFTLDDLAEALGLSKYHFCREFKKATGVTPMAFVRQVRVEAARSLLLSTSLTLKGIAEQVGFSDEFQLSRVFRRVTGFAPSHVRVGS